MRIPRDVDADFLALPLDALADAALQVAREAGASYAAVRVQQVRETVVRVRDRAVEGTSDVTDRGLSVRVVLDGAWGFAATGGLDVDGAARTAGLAVRSARVARPLVRRPVELAPVAVQQGTWVSSYVTDPFDVPTDEQAALLLGWTGQVLDAGGQPRRGRQLGSSRSRSSTPTLDGSRTVQQRVRMHPEVTAVGRRRGRQGRHRPRRSPRRSARGWEYLAAPDAPLAARGARPRRGGPGEARRPVGRARPLRPRHRPQPALADHPRVGRPRHGAGPGARLRGRLRRHVLRHARPARHPALRQRPDDRDRRPRGRARPVDGRLGRRGRPRADAGTSCATGSTSATSSTGPWPPSGARRPTAAPTRTARCTPRCSGCPT